MRRGKDATSSRARYGEGEDRYLELIRHFPLRPLHSDRDLDAAVAVIDSLIDRDDLTAPEQDYLDVLGSLVEAYENAAVCLKVVGDADMLRFLIEQKGVSQVDTARQAGIAESTISEVLAGKRKLNRSQIGKLAHYFNIASGAFAFTD